mmetsp:Transcript_17849/g.54578  ORF Transcript_17849/g.54578 Transcript_17849/m.54578 type:complete len:119 (+) Transcript_17849:2511-2867(+)
MASVHGDGDGRPREKRRPLATLDTNSRALVHPKRKLAEPHSRARETATTTADDDDDESGTRKRSEFLPTCTIESCARGSACMPLLTRRQKQVLFRFFRAWRRYLDKKTRGLSAAATTC